MNFATVSLRSLKSLFSALRSAPPASIASDATVLTASLPRLSELASDPSALSLKPAAFDDPCDLSWSMNSSYAYAMWDPSASICRRATDLRAARNDQRCQHSASRMMGSGIPSGSSTSTEAAASQIAKAFCTSVYPSITRSPALGSVGGTGGNSFSAVQVICNSMAQPR
jgi:hypothetical protein